MRGALVGAAERAAGHPRHVLLGALVAGLLLGPRAGPAAAVLAGAVLAVAAMPVRGAYRGLAVGAAACVLAGALGAQLRVAATDRTALGPWIGHAARAEVVALEVPRPRTHGREALMVRVVRGPGEGERVLLRVRGRSGLRTGRIAAVTGAWRPLPAFEGRARRAGAHALLLADAVRPTGARRGGPAGVLDGVRERAEAALGAGLPAPTAALARGMVLGQDEALPEGMREEFRASGLAHLLAASGANVALLAALVMALGALTGLPLRGRLAAALVAVAAYVPLAGGGPSIQRAGVMGAAGLVAALASRPSHRVYALLLAAAVTLAANPRAAGDPGWQLSFAAVVALFGLAPRLRAPLRRRLPAPVADVAALSAAATIGTAPLVALHFDRVSLVSVPANVLAAPVVAPIMWLGTLAALAGQAAPAAATPFAALAAWPLGFLAWLAAAAAGLPLAEARPAALLPVLVALALGAAAWRAGRGREGAPPELRRRSRAVRAVGLVAATTLLVLALRPAPVPGPPDGLLVSALDVGQGDATLIQHGGRAVLVDAGPPDGGVVARLREAGVRRLDLLVVTHAQADHEGGAADVLRAVPVGTVLDGRDGVPSAAGARLVAAARERGAQLVPATAGQRLRVGPMHLGVLWPPPRTASDGGGDPNDRAVVAELRAGGFSMLLPADAESEVLARLPLRPVDVLKVSHHGSDDPGLPAVLARLRPAVALIEVGRGNSYGHPTRPTLEALRVVPRVLRTDRDGTVRLRPHPRGVAVVAPA